MTQRARRHVGGGGLSRSDGINPYCLWREVLTCESLAELVELYIARIEEKNDAGKKRQRLVFPRYHQRDVVRKLLADVAHHGPEPQVPDPALR